MLNDILLDLYDSHSFLNRRHAISKIIAMLILFISLFFVRSFISLLFYLLVLIFLTFLSNIPISLYLRLLWQVKWFYIVLYVIYLLCGINPLNSVIMVLRIVFFVMLIFLFVFTTPHRELMYGLEWMLKPLSFIYIDTKAIAFSIFLGLQLIPMYLDELYHIKKLMKLKHGNKQTSFQFHIRQIKILLKNAFYKTISKMEQLSHIMEIRLYSTKAHKTYYQKMRFTCYDGLFIIAILNVLILLVLKETIL